MPLSIFRPDALRGYRLFESSDPDETRERISQVMQPHALVPTGKARGRSLALLTSARSHPHLAQQLERLLIDLLALGHTTDDLRSSATRSSSLSSPSSSRRTGVAPAIVKRAEYYIQAHGNDIASVGDLTAPVGVPATTLRDAFQHFRGISPMQYVRQSRLDRARETLVRALHPSDVRIADLALNCGFTHLGRFAQAYRERFGESPSQTLKARR